MMKGLARAPFASSSSSSFSSSSLSVSERRRRRSDDGVFSNRSRASSSSSSSSLKKKKNKKILFVRGISASSSSSSKTTGTNEFKTSDGVTIRGTFAEGGGEAQTTTSDEKRTALIMLHGSYHASWCFSENFFDYFSGGGRGGYGTNVDAYAMDFRGQGASDVPVKDGKAMKVAGTLERHARDVREYVEHVMREKKDAYDRVYLVGHSFGGLIAQKVYAEDGEGDDGKGGKLFDGMILLASVPPTGNGEMVKRFLREDLWKSMKITYAFIAKQFGTDAKSCRECFFSESVAESEIEKYMRLINDSSKARLLDLKQLNEELPIVVKNDAKKGNERVLVIGGQNDYVVDNTGVRETAAFWRSKEILIDGSAHDVMLDSKWQTVAEIMMQFIDA